MEETIYESKVEHKDTIEEPTRELITPPPTYFPPELTKEQERGIILGSMGIPFDEMQCAIPGLEKLSQNEIKNFFSSFLKNPPENQFSNDFNLTIPFTSDEELELLIFSRRNVEISKVFDFCPSILPIRSISSLEKEVERLSNLDDASKQKIFDEMTEKIVREQLCYFSYEDPSKSEFEDPTELKGYRCIPRESVCKQPTEDSKREIDNLGKITDDYLETIFLKTELGMLHAGNVRFTLNRMRTTIGRSTKSTMPDIDLNTIPGVNCQHISSIQCVISFINDFEFYLENLGRFAIRVNGVEIPPSGVCRLKKGCVIDIFGILLMFLPNTTNVERIKNAVTKKIGKKRQKK